jgi:hypothetical protein
LLSSSIEDLQRVSHPQRRSLDSSHPAVGPDQDLDAYGKAIYQDIVLNMHLQPKHSFNYLDDNESYHNSSNDKKSPTDGWNTEEGPFDDSCWWDIGDESCHSHSQNDADENFSASLSSNHQDDNHTPIYPHLSPLTNDTQSWCDYFKSNPDSDESNLYLSLSLDSKLSSTNNSNLDPSSHVQSLQMISHGADDLWNNNYDSHSESSADSGAYLPLRLPVQNLDSNASSLLTAYSLLYSPWSDCTSTNPLAVEEHIQAFTPEWLQPGIMIDSISNIWALSPGRLRTLQSENNIEAWPEQMTWMLSRSESPAPNLSDH